MDLVMVDTTSEPAEALALLEALCGLPQPPPRLALCDAQDTDTRAKAIRLARMVSHPVDVDELRSTVLGTLTQVDAKREDEPG